MPPDASISRVPSGTSRPGADRLDPVADDEDVAGLVDACGCRPWSARCRRAGRSSRSRLRCVVARSSVHVGRCPSSGHDLEPLWSGRGHPRQESLDSARQAPTETGWNSVTDTCPRNDVKEDRTWPTDPHRTARRPAGRRLLADPGRPLRHHAARRPRAPRWSRSSRRPATTPAPGQPPVRDGVSTYYLGVNRNKRSIALDLKDADDLAAGPGARRPRRRPDRELPARRAGPLRPRLRRRRRRQPARRLRLHQRLRHADRRAAPCPATT